MTTLRESAICEVDDRVLSLVMLGDTTIGWRELNLCFSDGADFLTLFFFKDDEFNPQGIKPLLKLTEVFESFLHELNELTPEVRCRKEFLFDDSFAFAGYTLNGFFEENVPTGFFVLYDNNKTIMWKASSRDCENVEQESLRRKEFFQKILIILQNGYHFLTKGKES